MDIHNKQKFFYTTQGAGTPATGRLLLGLFT